MTHPTSRPPGRARNSRQADAIESVLRAAEGFLTAQQVFDTVRATGDRIGLTTVYRHVNLLAAHGRADVVHSADGESQFRLCGDGGTAEAEHHHHVVCRVCGRSVEVSAPEVEAWAERVATAAGYTEISHTLEVFGMCPEHSARPSRLRPVAAKRPTRPRP